MSKFTVVIPLYNKAAYIAGTVKSVLNQTCQDFELIIVDDGSQDGGADCLKSIEDSRIRIIRQENQGVSAARNTGVWNATGTYIAFLDADDSWEGNYLEEISEIIERYPDSDIFVTGYYILMGNGTVRVSNESGQDRTGQISYWNTLKHAYDFVWTSATVIRRSAVMAVQGFKPGERIGQDLDLWARVAQKNPLVAYSEKRCVNYNRNAENNARVRIRVANADAFMQDLRFELENCERTEEERLCIASKLRKKLIVYIFTTILAGNRKGGRRLIRQNQEILGLFYSFSLMAASLLPDFINNKVFEIRMRVF